MNKHLQTNMDGQAYADAYASHGISGTAYLAYRDLPLLFERHVNGKIALDHGCGPGRSTRYLKDYGFSVTAVDRNPAMIEKALQVEQHATYHLVDSLHLPADDESFDLVFSCMVFPEYASAEEISLSLVEFRRVLRPSGIVIIIGGTRANYTRDSLSFLCDFPKNHTAAVGDPVQWRLRNLSDTPYYDRLWTEKAYRELLAAAQLSVLEVHHPLGTAEDPYDWVFEDKHSPWNVIVGAKTA